jgi:hypothetical protein
MNKHRVEIEEAMAPLLARGFRVVSVIETPEHFGDTQIVIASDTLQLRFTSDRGQKIVEIARGGASRGWYDLSGILAKSLLLTAAGPWARSVDAVEAFQKNEALVVQHLHDPAWLSDLVASP